jgi:acetoin utilization deacetylase AcuC-like enzyme
LRVAYISHSDCLDHDTGEGHPENARRLGAIGDLLRAKGLFDFLYPVEAPEATREQLLRVHAADYLDYVASLETEQGRVRLDPDTVLGPGSLRAARRAAGAVVHAVELLMDGRFESAFCAVRPPGHHAEAGRGMGFCIYNNIAVGAAHALAAHGLDRVAILDFDVHQGNGTEQIFAGRDDVLFCSTFQHPFYPGSAPPPIGDREVSIALPAGAGSAEFRAAVDDEWMPAIERFEPRMIFVSAGFDAHHNDVMSGVKLVDDDYAWVSRRIVDAAERHAGGRIVSALEGGYELDSLARCVELHLRALMGLD